MLKTKQQVTRHINKHAHTDAEGFLVVFIGELTLRAWTAEELTEQVCIELNIKEESK